MKEKIHNTSLIFNERQTHGNFESILIQFEDISSHLELNGVIWRANNDAKKRIFRYIVTRLNIEII